MRGIGGEIEARLLAPKRSRDEGGPEDDRRPGAPLGAGSWAKDARGCGPAAPIRNSVRKWIERPRCRKHFRADPGDLESSGAGLGPD